MNCLKTVQKEQHPLEDIQLAYKSVQSLLGQEMACDLE